MSLLGVLRVNDARAANADANAVRHAPHGRVDLGERAGPVRNRQVGQVNIH